MAVQMTSAPARPRRLLRSVAAVFAGFVAVFVLSIATDIVLHALGVYPPWGEPMRGAGLNLLAFAYRCVYAILGSYIAARLAPSAPMRHAMALGLIGLVPSTAGAIATWNMDLGPHWFPVALVLSCLPCAWLGGVMHRALAK
jgi:hypothetical protein